MRNLFVAVALATAVFTSIATSSEEPTQAGTTTGPWQASDSQGGTFTLAPNETQRFTLVVSVHQDSVATLTEDASLTVYLTPSNQQAAGAAFGELSGGGQLDDTLVQFSQETLFLDGITTNCTVRSGRCERSYVLEIDHRSGGRLDVSWFAEAVVYGDGGVEAPIELYIVP